MGSTVAIRSMVTFDPLSSPTGVPMKFPIYRALSVKGYEVEGHYARHYIRQPYPINDSLKDEDVRHYLISSTPADWGMGRNLEAYEIDFSTLTLVKEIS